MSLRSVMKKPVSISVLMSTLALAACSTTPVVETLLLSPPEGLLRPCYLPPNMNPQFNRELVQLALDYKLSAELCSARMNSLVEWYVKASDPTDP